MKLDGQDVETEEIVSEKICFVMVMSTVWKMVRIKEKILKNQTTILADESECEIDNEMKEEKSLLNMNNMISSTIIGAVIVTTIISVIFISKKIRKLGQTTQNPPDVSPSCLPSQLPPPYSFENTNCCENKTIRL